MSDRPSTNPTQAASRGDVGEVLLELTDVCTHFRTPRGLVRAVDGVSLELRRGEALGIVGESGSGKTILSRSIMGLLPTHNTVRKGSVLFEGQEIGKRSRKQMRNIWGREMAMIFQDPMTSLNPLMRIGDQLTEPLTRHLGMKASDARDTAEKLLTDVRIPEAARRLKQYPHEMSGGMRQRVMIAIAMSCGPTMILADEPTTALDVTVQAQILDLLGEQRRERNMSLILVTHDLGVVAGHTDHIAVMYGGRIVEKAPDGRPVRQHAHAVHRGADGEHPQARRHQPHPAAGHRRTPAGPGQPAEGLPVRASLRLRPRQVPHRGAAADRRRRQPGAQLPLLVPGRLARVPGEARRAGAGAPRHRRARVRMPLQRADTTTAGMI